MQYMYNIQPIECFKEQNGLISEALKKDISESLCFFFQLLRFVLNTFFIHIKDIHYDENGSLEAVYIIFFFF